MKLSEFKKLKEHCWKQENCASCGKGWECFDVFGKYKPRDFAVRDGKIRRVINGTK